MQSCVRGARAIVSGMVLGSAFIVSACNSDAPNPASPSPSGGGDGSAGNPITVFITNSTYAPNPLSVKVGQYVNFKNNDLIEHSATFDNGTYESGNIPPQSAHDEPVAQSAPGTYTFHCRMHGEKGSIVVTQ